MSWSETNDINQYHLIIRLRITVRNSILYGLIKGGNWIKI